MSQPNFDLDLVDEYGSGSTDDPDYKPSQGMDTFLLKINKF